MERGGGKRRGEVEKKKRKREGLHCVNQGATAPASYSSPHPPTHRPLSQGGACTHFAAPPTLRGPAHTAQLPAVLSLSRIRKDPWVFPGAKSCRSASFRLRFLKNQLHKADGRLSAVGWVLFFSAPVLPWLSWNYNSLYGLGWSLNSEVCLLLPPLGHLWPVLPPLWSNIPHSQDRTVPYSEILGCARPNPQRSPAHGSGSRLFALATKLKGMKPS